MRVLFVLALLACTQGQSVPPEMMGLGAETRVPYPQISPQTLSQLSPSQYSTTIEPRGLNTEATIDTPAMAPLGSAVDPSNGLPQVSVQAALSQFMADEKADQERESFLAAQQAMQQQQQSRDLEEEAKSKDKPHKGTNNKGGFAPHAAVPKLQKWLAAMDPMSYVAPTFTNPVAKHFFDQIADPKLPPDQRERMQRLVSSPYMFQMLGNPAYEDPKLWTGLVSGAAVPYPMRNAIMGQRTMLPYQIAATGDAMTDNDQVAMNEYKKEAERSGTAGQVPNTASHIKARKRLNHIFAALNGHYRNERSHTEPTPHDDLFEGLTK